MPNITLPSLFTAGLRFFSLFYCGMLFFAAPVYAINYIQNVRQIGSAKYEHWNEKDKSITGYTLIKYQPSVTKQLSFLVETSQNMTKEGDIYGEKKIWFSENDGSFIKSIDSDFRTKTSITSQAAKGQITTQLINPTEKKILRIKKEPRLILFETLSLGLQSFLPTLLSKKQAKFTLYVPVLALELERYRLPQSMSKISMVAKLERVEFSSTLFGKKQTAQILVQPDSFFLRSVLPRSKTEFRFTFLAEKPYYLLSFKDEIGTLRLVEFEQKNYP